MNNEPTNPIEVGAIVRRRFIKKAEAEAKGTGKVVALGKKYRGARVFPAAKVQFKSTSRVLWYFLDQLQLVPEAQADADAQVAPKPKTSKAAKQ